MCNFAAREILCADGFYDYHIRKKYKGFDLSQDNRNEHQKVEINDP
ncbi:conserved hypothetical protein [delta proteobacterium NaphS2]|nr:conserved hypothetical protein [delta proteobacterium NaphS2]